MPDKNLWRFPSNTGRLNILSSLATLGICVVGGWDLIAYNTSPTSNWRGVGQSLIAAGAVAFVGLLSSIFQYFLVTRPYDFIVSLGIRRFRKRGVPGSGWPRQLRGAKRRITFFGKDHNKLMVHTDLLKQLIVDNVTITFYLLNDGDDYYRTRPDELAERHEAARSLFRLRSEIAAVDADAARRLLLFQYSNLPTFACTMLDDTIIFGPYLPDLKNADTPEFEIDPSEETWLYDACTKALQAAVTDDRVSTLLLPVANVAAPAVNAAHADGG